LGIWVAAASGHAQTCTFNNVAGNTSAGSVDGTNASAQFSGPSGVTSDAQGNLYVVDQYNCTIRKISPVSNNWVVSTIAGDPGLVNFNRVQDGTNSQALFNFPAGIAVDPSGNLYVADQDNNAIRKIALVAGTTNWVVATIAGKGPNSPGNANGTNSTAQFNGPTGIAVDANSNVFVADQYNNTIRKITPVAGTTNWVVTTLAGQGPTAYGSADGTNTAARFYWPTGVAVDTNDNLFVADQKNNTIRKMTPSGTNWIVTTIAGQGPTAYGSADGTNTAAQFHYPTGVAVDTNDNVYVADNENFTIRKLTPIGTNWVTSTIGGSVPKGGPASGDSNGSGASASFYYPFGIAVDAKGSVFVADQDNNTIRIGFPPPAILTAPPPFGVNAGQFGFNLTGPTAQLAIIQASSDLQTWLPIWTNAFGPGTLLFTDPQAATAPARFYRVEIP
jgi:streptogramin lyase